jgi:peptide/nickel transport system substrate-binding protein
MLADKIEIIDPTEVHVTLKDAVFQDKPPVSGRKVIASDVVESWKAFATDPFGLGREWLKTIMDRLEATNDNTLLITQKKPWAWMWGTAGAGSPASSSILPAETIDGKQFDLANDVCGSGRFLVSNNQGGQNLQLRRFDKWRIPGQPFLAGVNFVFIPDYTSAETQFAAGQLDDHAFQNKLQADEMQSRLGNDITITQQLSRSYHCLMLKQIPPFDDPRVRKAIRLAIDRKKMIKLVERDVAGGVLSGVVPPAQKLFALPEDDSDLQDYVRYDKEEAKSLLDAASFPYDKEFTLLISSPSEEIADRALVLKDQLSEVGIKLKIEPQDLFTVWIPRVLLNADYQMTLFTHLAYEDPYLPLAFYTTYSPIGPVNDQGRNSMLFYDQDIDDAVDAASAALDFDDQAAKVKAAQKVIMQKEGPMINLYSSVNFGARWNWLKGVVEGRGSFGLFSGTTWVDTSMRG